MNEEILKELKKTNEKLDNVLYYQESINGHQEYIDGTTGSIYKQLENTNENYYDVQVLTLIFGFIVGYCLIKSFFEGLKI